MSITIKSERVERLVREVAAITQESLTETVGHALEDRLIRLRGRRLAPNRVEAMLEISRRCAALPDLDPRPTEEILDYGEEGAPRGG
jgi:antitoxin VapB